MNYLEIILEGILNPDNNGFLINYFKREIVKAEKENYSAEEFCSGCMGIISNLKAGIDKQFYTRKKELLLMKEIASQKINNSNHLFIHDVESYTLLQNCVIELNSITKNNFSVNVSSLTKSKYVGTLWHKEILDIENAINCDELFHSWKKKNEFCNSKINVAKSENKIDIPKDEIKFDHLIFKDQESYNLFLFLVDEYAMNYRVKQFSQIYHWLVENSNRIKPNTGAKYQEHVKVNFPLMTAKFSRIEEKKPYEMITLNDVFKRF